MKFRHLARSALVAFVVGFCVLEALAWARLGAIDLVRASAPRAGVSDDRTPIFFRYSRNDIDVWAADGTPIGIGGLRSGDAFTSRFGGTIVSEGFSRHRRSGIDKTTERAAFLPTLTPPRDDARRLASQLDRNSTTWHLWAPLLGNDPPSFADRAANSEARWSFEGGRLVARGGDARVLAEVGPSGTSESSNASEVGRFGRLIEVLRFPGGDGGFSEGPVTYVLFDVESNRVVELTHRPADTVARVAIDVRSVALHPAAPDEEPTKQGVFLVKEPGRIVVFDRDGTVWTDLKIGADDGRVDARIHRGPSEVAGTRNGGPWVFAASSPIDLRDPLATGTRLRHQVLGRALSSWDFAWTPSGPYQQALVALACVPAVLRPLPLTAASFLSGAPTDGEGGASWWWMDPVLAGQRRPVALVANVLLAALCAAFAWRIGRVHCRTATAARAVALTGLLLGPLGLLLIRILVVRAPAERIGRGKRSLLLDTCPATDTPWPEPARTGREIFEGA